MLKFKVRAKRAHRQESQDNKFKDVVITSNAAVISKNTMIDNNNN